MKIGRKPGTPQNLEDLWRGGASLIIFYFLEVFHDFSHRFEGDLEKIAFEKNNISVRPEFDYSQ